MPSAPPEANPICKDTKINVYLASNELDRSGSPTDDGDMDQLEAVQLDEMELAEELS